MANTFLEALHSGRVLLMDGAMGTELQRTGIQQGECYELWNLTHPERVLEIHRAYVEAGAEVLLTNTFQANATALAKHGIEKHLEAIDVAAIEHARNAAVGNRYVVASVGPYLPTNKSKDMWQLECTKMYSPLLTADAILLETWSELNECLNLLHFIRRVFGHIPTLISHTFCRNGVGELRTVTGFAPEAVAARVKRLANNTVALGVNCGRDITMDDCTEIIRRYRAVTDLPLFARPNAGTPTQINNQWVYPQTPEQMAAKLPQLLEAGATMVGGCCGTTPAHIAAVRGVVDDWNAKKHAARS